MIHVEAMEQRAAEQEGMEGRDPMILWDVCLCRHLDTRVHLKRERYQCWLPAAPAAKPLYGTSCGSWGNPPAHAKAGSPGSTTRLTLLRQGLRLRCGNKEGTCLATGIAFIRPEIQ